MKRAKRSRRRGLPHNKPLQWTGPASGVLVKSKPVGAVPAAERRSVMPQETLDYRSAIAHDPTRRSNRAAGVVAASVVAANLALVCIVLLAPGLGPAVALLGVPFVNFGLLLIAVGCTPLAKMYARGGSLRPYVVV